MAKSFTLYKLIILYMLNKPYLLPPHGRRGTDDTFLQK